jgi:hypothetical protein
VKPSRRQRHDPRPGRALLRVTRRVDVPRVVLFAFAQTPWLGFCSY